MKVFFTDAAKADLFSIDLTISRDNPATAERFAGKLRAACEGLGELPERFQIDAGTGLRRRPVSGYLIFYAVSDRVEIVRILHGARDLSGLLDEG